MKISIEPFLVISAAAVLLCACDGSTGGSSSTSSSPGDTITGTSPATKPQVTAPTTGTGLVGKWSSYQIMDNEEYRDTLQMRADGTFHTETTYRYLGTPPRSGVDIVDGIWSVSGNKITMTVHGDIQVGIYTLTGPYLIFANSDGSDPDTVTRVP